jgi:hypothetical protein
VGLRIRLAPLLAYLLSPIDLVPDSVPVIGYADDVVIVALELRSVITRAGRGGVSKALVEGTGPVHLKGSCSSSGWPGWAPRR